jgi:hypothetical protein
MPPLAPPYGYKVREVMLVTISTMAFLSVIRKDNASTSDMLTWGLSLGRLKIWLYEPGASPKKMKLKDPTWWGVYESYAALWTRESVVLEEE